MPSKQPDHIVIGAGFTGLLYATLSILKGETVHVYEKRNRIGGLIQSVRTPFGLVETAANGILNSYRLEALASELNLELLPSRKDSKKRYIWIDGGPKRIPISFFGALRVLYGIAAIPSGVRGDESVFQWGKRVLGEEAVKNILEPGLSGIYAGDLRTMSAKLVLEKFLTLDAPLWKNIRATIAAKKNLPRVPKSRRGTVSFRGGLGELLNAMETKVKSSLGSEIFYSETAPSLAALRKKYPKSKITIAAGLESSLRILSSFDPNFKRYVRVCRSLSVVTATRFGKKTLLGNKNGFGILFPPGSGFRARGVLLNSQIFDGRAADGNNSETYIFGGALDEEIAKSKESEIISFLEEDRKRIVPGGDDPLNHYVTVWKSALPAYDAALLEFNRELDRSLPEGVFVEGNFRYGIGLSFILERAWGRRAFDR